MAGIVLAAGFGRRLRPLTDERPKALCPVGGVAMVDRALAGLGAPAAGLGLSGPEAVAVNAHHRAADLAAHLDGRVHLSPEPALLGAGGTLAALRPWVDGRHVVVVNADAVHDADLAPVLDGWDGERIRVLAAEPAGTPFGPAVRLCAVAMPWAEVAGLAAGPGSVYRQAWAPAAEQGRLEVVPAGARAWFDCGTPASYLAANLWATGGSPAIGAEASVAGRLERAVVWDGAQVRAAEHLVDAVRTTRGRTVLVR